MIMAASKKSEPRSEQLSSRQHSSLSESSKISGDTVTIPPNQGFIVTQSATSLCTYTLSYNQAIPEKIVSFTFQSISCPILSAPHLSTKQRHDNSLPTSPPKNYWIIKSDPRLRVVILVIASQSSFLSLEKLL